jgi:hypothetical protein
MRTYIPNIGARVKLREFNSYTSRNIHVWAWFDVLSVDRKAGTATIQHNNAGTLLETVTIPLTEIQSPLGWQPRYTIAVKPDKVQTVLEWFARGIAVHVSHDIGNYSEVFQPLDTATPPGWRYPEETDRILPEDCAKIFRIVSVEQEEVSSATLGYPADKACPHCLGTGRRSIQRLAIIRQETVAKLQSLIDTGQIRLDDLNGETFRCNCHYGAFSRLSRKERNKLFAEWKRDGWQTEYVRWGNFYQRRRETVVHEWAGEESKVTA